MIATTSKQEAVRKAMNGVVFILLPIFLAYGIAITIVAGTEADDSSVDFIQRNDCSSYGEKTKISTLLGGILTGVLMCCLYPCFNQGDYEIAVLPSDIIIY